jgi:hypothetical protein
MANRSRISKNAADFMAFMNRTNKLQLSPGTPPATYKWQEWGWKPDESTQWTNYQQQTEMKYKLYVDPANTGPAVIKGMNILISQVRSYDNDKIKGHHLLDKVAMSGTISDCETFNIKRGTALAHDARRPNSDTPMLRPLLSVRRVTFNGHLLAVTNPETPRSNALPEGIAFAKVYRYIGTEPPTSYNQYEFFANAHRGFVVSKFDGDQIHSSLKCFAWYIARYESKKGMLGDPSAPEKVQILS